MKDLKTIIEAKIKEKGISKDLISNYIGMERTSFYLALKKGDIKLKNFAPMLELLNIEPNYFFEWSNENITHHINEPDEKYEYKKKNDTKSDTLSEIEYLRLQNDRLLRIIENFSLQIDTKSIS